MSYVLSIRSDRGDEATVTTNDEDGWLLVIDPALRDERAPNPSRSSAQPIVDFDAHRILGLSVVLRLALTAQAAGARAVALANAAANLRPLLGDPRLRIPVIDEADRPHRPELRTTTRAIRVPANTVTHRATLVALCKLASQDELRLMPPLATAPGNDTWLAARGATGIFGFDPMVVVDAPSAKAARLALLRSLRKPQDGWTSTYLNRHISLFLTRWLVATPLRPNQLSVAILGVGLAGAALASRGTYVSLLVGALLFQAQSVLDGCDGEMSRLTFRGSRTGEWLDTVGDDLTNYGFFAGAAWGLYTTSAHWIYLAIGALTVSCGLLGSGLEYRYLISIGSGDLLKYPLGIGKSPGAAQPSPGPARIFDAISPLFKRDTFVLLTLVGAALGLLGPFLAVFALGAVGVLFAVIKAEIRMSRERGQAALHNAS
jgi:phosphatidylglycerophosphate synthase